MILAPLASCGTPQGAVLGLEICREAICLESLMYPLDTEQQVQGGRLGMETPHLLEQEILILGQE